MFKIIQKLYILIKLFPFFAFEIFLSKIILMDKKYFTIICPRTVKKFLLVKTASYRANKIPSFSEL